MEFLPYGRQSIGEAGVAAVAEVPRSERITQGPCIGYNERRLREGGIMRLSEAKRRYAGQWIAFRKTGRGEDPEGEVVLHDADRHVFDRKWVEEKPTMTYVTFAGEPVPEGYATMLSIR